MTRLIHEGRRHLGLILALTLGLGLGCSDGKDLYAVRIKCLTKDDQPVPDIKLAVGGATIRSDEQGIADLQVPGVAGDQLSLQVLAAPPGFELAKRDLSLTLRGRPGSGTPATHELRFSRTRDRYVVMVAAASAPGLLVEAAGQEVAKLNSHSAAAFIYEGRPNDRLKVIIKTSEDLIVNRSNPYQEFILPESSAILSFKSDLAIRPPAAPKPRAAVRSGPVKKVF